MKKLLSVLLSVAMLLTLAMPAMAAPTEPDEQPDRQLSAQITAEGGTLTLNLTATQPINNGSLTLTYPDGLQLVSASSPVRTTMVSKPLACRIIEIKLLMLCSSSTMRTLSLIFICFLLIQ